MLKNLQAKNLITLCDCEKADLDIHFLIADAKQCLRTLAATVTSNQLFIMPNSNEEIIFKRYPSTGSMELKKIRKLLLKGDASGASIGSMKPKGDVNSSPTASPNQSDDQVDQDVCTEEVK